MLFLYCLLSAISINILSGELCHTTTTRNPYFHYHKCATTDAIMICENCDDYQPSCNADSECTNGEACCEASCSPSSCKQCRGIIFEFCSVIFHNTNFNFLKSTMSSSRYYFL